MMIGHSRLMVLLAAGLVLASCTTSKAVKEEKQRLLRDLGPEEFETRVDAYRLEIQSDLDALTETAFDRLEKDWQSSLDNATQFAHDVLILSGGGAKGAFGAGFLRGWGEVSDEAEARPDFDVVTGVSTGALIAPFAFVGSKEAYVKVADFYADPQENWIKKRGELIFLPSHLSLFNNLGLQDYIRRQLDETMIEGMAQEAGSSRLLLIGATNADIGIGRVFDLGREAARAHASGDPDRVHSILLASSAIPGVFPPIEIDDFYYVDGGVSSQIVSILPLEFAHGPLQEWPATTETQGLGHHQREAPTLPHPDAPAVESALQTQPRDHDAIEHALLPAGDPATGREHHR